MTLVFLVQSYFLLDVSGSSFYWEDMWSQETWGQNRNFTLMLRRTQIWGGRVLSGFISCGIWGSRRVIVLHNRSCYISKVIAHLGQLGKPFLDAIKWGQSWQLKGHRFTKRKYCKKIAPVNLSLSLSSSCLRASLQVGEISSERASGS